jgi:preprotein translocase subunit SecA
MNEYIDSPFYKKLGRHKKLLTEKMTAVDKDFVIKKASTAGQITICTAVFGRGTDFFCKDEVVERNGGVHIMQTFLYEEKSEEVQIQGRTARQGKKGSYQMILLESDLEEEFLLKRERKIMLQERITTNGCAMLAKKSATTSAR